MARNVCLVPCAPTNLTLLPQLSIPLSGGGSLRTSGSLSFDFGCNGCEITASLMTQLNALLGSMGLPLCTLRCLGAITKFAKAVPDALGPPPDPTTLFEALGDIASKCACVVGFVLPPPVGVICDFLKLVRDVLVLIDRLLACVTSLLHNLITVNVRAAVLLGSTSPEVRRAGQCLNSQVAAMMNILLGKLSGATTLFEVIQPIVSLLADVVPPPFSSLMTQLSNGFVAFSSSMSIGVPPGTFLTSVQEFADIVHDVTVNYAAVVGVCP